MKLSSSNLEKVKSTKRASTIIAAAIEKSDRQVQRYIKDNSFPDDCEDDLLRCISKMKPSELKKALEMADSKKISAFLTTDRIRFYINNTIKILDKQINSCLENPERYRDVLDKLYDMKAQANNDLTLL